MESACLGPTSEEYSKKGDNAAFSGALVYL